MDITHFSVVFSSKVFFLLAKIQKTIIFLVFYKTYLYLCTKHKEIEI
jgi:hypothetical protein